MTMLSPTMLTLALFSVAIACAALVAFYLVNGAGLVWRMRVLATPPTTA